MSARPVLAGIVQLAAGAMRVGGWFRAISPAVVPPACSAAGGLGVLIVLAQITVLADGSPQAGGLTDNLVAIPAQLLRFRDRRG